MLAKGDEKMLLLTQAEAAWARCVRFRSLLREAEEELARVNEQLKVFEEGKK